MKRLLFVAVLVAVLSGLLPVVAVAQEVSVRFYIVLLERVTFPDGHDARGPMYFEWRYDPDPENAILVDKFTRPYGLVDMAVVGAQVTTEQDAYLVSHADVFGFPANLDANMSHQEVVSLTDFLEGALIPAQWLAGNPTYREVLRTVTGMFIYMQAVTGILQYDPITGIDLNTHFGDLPQDVQNAMQQAAINNGYSWEVRSNDLIRNILKDMADECGATPIHFGPLGDL